MGIEKATGEVTGVDIEKSTGEVTGKPYRLPVRIVGRAFQLVT